MLFSEFARRFKENFSYAEGRGNKRIAARRELLTLYLRSNPCVDCGEGDPVVLECDHRDPLSKEFSISAGYRKSFEDFAKEVDKCDVRCANCHRRKTHREQDYLIRRAPDIPAQYDHGSLRRDLSEEKANRRNQLRNELATETAFQRRRASATPRGAVRRDRLT